MKKDTILSSFASGAILFLSLISFAQDKPEGYLSRDDIRNRLLGSENYEERDLRYRPRNLLFVASDGRSFRGYPLPNGRIAPAYEDEFGKVSPGCYDPEEGEVLYGIYDYDTRKVLCGRELQESGIISHDARDSTIQSEETETAPAQSELQREEPLPPRSPFSTADNTDNKKNQKISNKKEENTEEKKEAKVVRASPPPLRNTTLTASSRSSKPIESAKTSVAGLRLPSLPTNTYKPPPRNSGGGDKMGVANFGGRGSKYGIALGTMARAMLVRDVSSLETESVEIELLEDVVGNRKRLPKGTVFFATGVLNEPAGTFDMIFKIGVTPGGEELQVAGSVFRRDNKPGLIGTIYDIKEEQFTSSLRTDASNVVGEVLSDAAGSGLRTTTQQITTNIREDNEKKPAPKRFIRVPHQEVLVRFSRSF